MFKAERIDGMGLIGGYYVRHQYGSLDKHYIITLRGGQFEVHGDTVRQVEYLPRPMPKMYTPALPIK